MMQVEAVIGSLSSTMRKTGLMSPFSSSAGSSRDHPGNKKHQKHAINSPAAGQQQPPDGGNGNPDNVSAKTNPKSKIIAS